MSASTFELGAPANVEVLRQFLPAVGTRVILEPADEVPEATDAVVVAVIDGDDGLELVAPEAIGAAAKELLATLEAVSASAKAEAVTVIPAPESLNATVVAAVGLGADDVDAEDIRRASGAVARKFSKYESVLSTLGAIDAQAAAEGFALGAYSYSGLKSDKEASAEKSLQRVEFWAPLRT